MKIWDGIVVGAGQSGLASAYCLQKFGVVLVMLDAHDSVVCMRPDTWPALTLFSPADASNLPGKPMPSYPGFPPASHVVEYLEDYEARYDFPIIRPVRVEDVTVDDEVFRVHAGDKEWHARAEIGRAHV